MFVSDIQLAAAGEHCELRARLSSHASRFEPFSLWFRVPREFADRLTADRGDPFLAGLLLPAMVVAEPLVIAAPVSAKLLRASVKIRSIYRWWARGLQEIDLLCDTAEDEPARIHAQPTTGIFFSAGVDSFYSLLKERSSGPDDTPPITHLIPVHGFDMFVTGPEQALFPPLLTASRKVGR